MFIIFIPLSSSALSFKSSNTLPDYSEQHCEYLAEADGYNHEAFEENSKAQIAFTSIYIPKSKHLDLDSLDQINKMTNLICSGNKEFQLNPKDFLLFNFGKVATIKTTTTNNLVEKMIFLDKIGTSSAIFNQENKFKKQFQNYLKDPIRLWLQKGAFAPDFSSFNWHLNKIKDSYYFMAVIPQGIYLQDLGKSELKPRIDSKQFISIHIRPQTRIDTYGVFDIILNELYFSANPGPYEEEL